MGHKLFLWRSRATIVIIIVVVVVWAMFSLYWTSIMLIQALSTLHWGLNAFEESFSWIKGQCWWEDEQPVRGSINRGELYQKQKRKQAARPRGILWLKHGSRTESICRLEVVVTSRWTTEHKNTHLLRGRRWKMVLGQMWVRFAYN